MFDPILYHGIIGESGYRIIFGFKTGQYFDSKGSIRADLMLLLPDRSIRFVSRVDHLFSRKSYEFYIDFRHREKMLEDVKNDVDKRKIWAHRIEEYNDIVDKFIDPETLSDGFGNSWSAICPTCKHKSMQIVRPGKVQCSNCD